MKDKCIRKIETRQSIRRFTGDSIPEGEILEIIKIGLSAPSAGNKQPWRIVLVTDEDLKEQLATAAMGQSFLIQAAVVLVICAVPQESAERYGERGSSLYAFQDTAALIQNILLASHMSGYGTCWVGAFDESEVSRVLNIPKSMRPVALIPIGIIAGDLPNPRPRKQISEILIRESFS
jgi:nitroreductase